MRSNSNRRFIAGSALAALLMLSAAASLAHAQAAAPAAAPPIGVDEGRPEVSWQNAGRVVGKVVFVSGKIIGVGRGGEVNFLNFDEARPPKFAAIVFQDNVAKFPKPLKEMYEGKLVRIRGMVTTYREQPQIVVTSPDQIQTVDKLPPETPVAAPRGAKGGEITIGCYNVLNLFDDVDDPYLNDEGTPAKPREQMEHVAKVIRQLDADVLALEEVENRGYVERFIDVFLADMGYENVVFFEGNDYRGIDVCVLSRFPVGPVISHRHLKFPGPDGTTQNFSRDVLVATIEPPDAAPIEVWAIHLKSNSGGREFSEGRRVAEARELRKLLDARLTEKPQTRLVVLGDFNDTFDSETLKTIVGSGATALVCPSMQPGRKPANHPETYNLEPFRSMIDFILCSPAMDKSYVDGSYHVVPGGPDTSGSDHNPVTARFKLK
jgi:endonuclease/exonuclease/phosphatase family metal-dependent hydrolase